jgi:nuclear transport factor 2 (NTF2) superfamily protein
MWEFNEEGLMARRFASINDATIHEDERRIFAAAVPAAGA